ncbi:hypothetical protein FOA43_003322 [Brettanomyces nanus]|uniref:Prolyl-tRNA synthetase n=1 Tax=Eeniella nana TaxID=13502 RepID=A0A875S3N6_EENNA|nr:uncharacterized protein FOA43_003322 [Brettanomyces nanus]QPG75936.1 hypothetical protein FOA43_003322 [Brettanomyces nanus]
MSLEVSLSLLSLAEPVPEGSIDLKTLVFKPKTPKSQTPVPIIVVAKQTTQTPSKLIGQQAEAKDPRLANDALTTELFGVAAKEFTIASLSVKNKGAIKVLLDSTISEDESIHYVISNSKGRLILNGKQLIGFLSLFTPKVVDFSKAPEPAAPKKQEKKQQKQTKVAKMDDAKLIGVTADKDKDFSGWYQQILVKGEMLDYYDVSGCYILRPGSYSIWEQIQSWFDKKIKENGVHNAYFPMFVSSKVLTKEKDHIEGFAPEVAWVTRAGSSELEEPIAIRPTSETVMYPYYSKWIRSHRDLPFKLNQWNSVVRWEFKHPQPFLRTREFLWQEGHTAHLTAEEAETQVIHILDLYEKIFVDLLALPVIKGKKTEKEKFAGGYYTTTCEGYIPTTGRGIQCATSHNLGQNFSKMFNISVENPEGSDKPKLFVHQTSWGLSTRVIGVMVMVHSDNKGLVVPPRVAQFQTVIIPVGLTVKTSKDIKNKVYDTCKKLEATLKNSGIRVASDYKDNYSPGWKFSQWELKGVPVRLEVGPKDIANGSALAVRRDTGTKTAIKLAEIAVKLPELFEEIHKNLYETAKRNFDDHRVIVHDWKDFVHQLNQKNIVLAPWCGVGECEEDIKKASAKSDNGEEFEIDDKAPSMGAKSLCIPFDQPELKEGTKCVKCGKPAVNYTILTRTQFIRHYSTFIASGVALKKFPLTKCIKDIYRSPPCANSPISLKGWVSGTRISKNVAFVDMVDGTTYEDVKCVVRPPYLLPNAVKVGTSIKIDNGLWVEGRGKQKYEVQVTENSSIGVIGEVEELFPLLKKQHTEKFLRTIPQYRWRKPEEAAILRFRSNVETALVNFFDQHSFTKTHPPIMTSSDCEGAGELFTVEAASNASLDKCFFGKEAYLTVSTQLHLEVLCAALNRVWTLTPCFRAEESDTNRHLSEFWMLEAEMAFTSRVDQLTDFSELMIKSVISKLFSDFYGMGSNLLKTASKEQGASMLKRWEMLLGQEKWASITYTDAIKILRTAYENDDSVFQYEPKWGDSLKSEHEKWIAGEYFKNPVFVTDYPVEEKAFYMKINEGGNTPAPTVACYDLLVPDIGELIGGSLREEEYGKLCTEIERRKLNLEPLKWYLAQRKNGTFPHGGFGMGFERLLQYLSCKDNIKDVIAFPRTVNNCLC